MIRSFFKIKNQFLASIFVCCLLSCQGKVNSEKVKLLQLEIDNVLNQELIVSKRFHLYKPFGNYLLDSVEMAKSKLKIYTQINASCGTCIDKIKLWEEFSNEINEYSKIPILLICKSEDNFESFKYLCESKMINKFTYPFVLDAQNEYETLNKFMDKKEGFKTLMTDEYNNILLVGNPIDSRKIKEIYLNEIKRRVVK